MTEPISGPVPRRRNALRDLLLGSLANYAFPVAALITSPILARGLGPDGRGALAAVLAPLSVADAIAAVGAPLAANYFVGAGRDVRSVRKYGAVVATVGGLVAVLALVLSSEVLLADYPDLRVLFYCLVPSVLIGGYINLYRGIRAGEHDYGKINANLWFGALARLAAIVVLAVTGLMTTTTVAALSIATGLAAGLALRSRRKPAAGTPVGFRAFTSYSLRGWFGGLSGSVTARVDQLFLITAVPAAALGNYAVAVTVAELPNAVSLVVQRLLLVRSSDGSRASALRGMRLTTLFNVLIGISVIALSEPLVLLLFGNEYTSAAGLLRILVIGTAAWGIGQGASGLLLAAGRPGAASSADVVSAVVTAAAIYPAVTLAGTTGAAIVSVSAYTVATVVKLVVVKRVLSLRWRDLLVADRSDVALVGRQGRQLVQQALRRIPGRGPRR